MTNSLEDYNFPSLEIKLVLLDFYLTQQFREGFRKNTREIIHILWIRGGGPQMWISNGGGSSHVDKKIP